MKLLTQINHKINKSNKSGKGYFTKILHLSPYTLSKCGNTCPNSTKGCRASCLNKSGHGVYLRVQEARIKRTKMFFQNPEEFRLQLLSEIEDAEIKAKKLGVQLAIRLNGTSDIAWEEYFPEIFILFPKVQFYDYTKIFRRLLDNRFKNYYLTYSRSEVDSDKLIKIILGMKKNVAVVYQVNRSKSLPKIDPVFGKIVDGDKVALRFVDKYG